MDRNLRLNGFRDRSDLVDLQQETIASLLLDSGFDTKGVGNGKIVTDDLNATLGGEVGPSLPIILVEWILDGDDGVLLDVPEVQISELDAGEPLRRVGIGVLEVKVVLAVLVELGGGDVKGDLDLSLVTSLLDGFAKEFKRFVCAGHIGSESSFVTNIDG